MTDQLLYIEEHNQEPFDWNVFLAQDNIAEDAWKDAYELASDWVTCACGNQCAVLPRNNYGEPRDLVLLRLGNDFYHAIDSRLVEEARRTLLLIERRSTYLLTLPNYIDPAA